MSRVMRTAFLGLVLTAMALEISPALAQNVEQVKPVFEHILPNTEGKSMIAVVVTYPPGAKSPAHHHTPTSYAYFPTWLGHLAPSRYFTLRNLSKTVRYDKYHKFAGRFGAS